MIRPSIAVPGLALAAAPLPAAPAGCIARAAFGTLRGPVALDGAVAHAVRTSRAAR